MFADYNRLRAFIHSMRTICFLFASISFCFAIFHCICEPGNGNGIPRAQNSDRNVQRSTRAVVVLHPGAANQAEDEFRGTAMLRKTQQNLSQWEEAKREN